MDKVNGLRSLNTPDTTLTNKRGRAQVAKPTTKARLNPVASPVDTFVGVGNAPDVSSQMEQLANALGGINPVLQQYANQYRMDTEKKNVQLEKEQVAKLKYYTDQVIQSKQSGAVNAAQVKEMYPELVPSVAMRIAQATGEIEAKQWVSGRIQNILEDEQLRLNTTARNAELETIRQEARGIIGDNEFYGSGFLGQLDKSLNEFSTSWMRETAIHHEAIQKESLAAAVVETINNGGDLLALDGDWKDTTSLSHKERNEVIVGGVIKHALATLDFKVLERIPDRFLNASHKAAINKASRDINDALFTQYTQKKRLEADARKAAIREGKNSVLERVASGEPLNPLEWRDNLEVYQFAVDMADKPLVNTVESKANVQRIRSQIMQGATTGDFVEALGSDFGVLAGADGALTEEALLTFITDHGMMNPQEKAVLLKELPTLMEGVDFIRDASFSSYFEDTVGSDAQVYASSVNGQTLSMASVNVLGDVRRAYNGSIRQAVLEYIKEKGSLPRNRIEIMEKAETVARQRLEYIQRNQPALTQAAFNRAKPGDRTGSPQPDTSSKSIYDGEYLVLPDGRRIPVKQK